MRHIFKVREDLMPFYSMTTNSEICGVGDFECLQHLTRKIQPDLVTSQTQSWLCMARVEPTDLQHQMISAPIIYQTTSHAHLLQSVNFSTLYWLNLMSDFCPRKKARTQCIWAIGESSKVEPGLIIFKKHFSSTVTFGKHQWHSWEPQEPHHQFITLLLQ